MSRLISAALREALGDPRNKADFESLIQEVQEIQAEMRSTVIPPGLEGSGRFTADTRSSWVTPEGQEIRVLRNTEALETSTRHQLPDGIKSNELSLGRMLRGIVLGEWRRAEAERRTLSVGDSSLGGYLVPSPLSTRVIDLARNQTRVMQAGAITVPMESNTLTLARVTGDPTAAWKAENAVGSFSDITFGAIELISKSLLALIKTSIEIFEDATNLSSVVENSLAEALALELDRAALYGQGSAAEPLGIVNAANVGVEDLGTNGAALTNYDKFSLAVEKILSANGSSTGLAAIFAPRTAGTLDRLKDTTNQPLVPSASFAALQKLVTKQVPINRTHGSASNASDVFLGDFQQLLIGMRTQLIIEVSRQAGDSAGSAFRDMQVWIRAYLRADVALAQPTHFCKIIGIIP